MHAVRIVSLLAVMMLALPQTFAQEPPAPAAPKPLDRAAAVAKAERIDSMAESTLDEILEAHPRARELHGQAYGCAVFQVVKVAIGITGGGGEGVAVAKQHTDEPTYMKMGTGGIGIGLGGQKYRVLFLFEDKAAFDEFVRDGWDADAEANAAAGNEGANKAASFSNGVVMFQVTDKGLLANADLSGTKYWADDELNRALESDLQTD